MSQNLEEIMESIDGLKLHFKSLANSCLTNQSGTCDVVYFFIKEEKRNKKCELLVDFNKRYILETNAEKKNRLKQLINTTTESIKSDFLEMMDDTECDEGIYLLYCELAKDTYTMIDDLLRMTKKADELTAL